MRDFCFAPSDRRLSFATDLHQGRESLHFANYSPKVTDEPNDFLPMVDAFLAANKYRQLQDWDDSQWEILKRCDAVTLLQHLLSTDMAYNTHLRDQVISEKWAREYVGAFDRNSVLLTNWHVYESGGFALWQEAADGCRSLSRGQSITDATFDSGVVCFDDQRIGIIWFTDED
jgi:hypothetical protein